MRLSPLESLYDATLGVRVCDVTVPAPAMHLLRHGLAPSHSPRIHEADC